MLHLGAIGGRRYAATPRQLGGISLAGAAGDSISGVCNGSQPQQAGKAVGA